MAAFWETDPVITAQRGGPRPVFTIPDPQGEAEERRANSREARAQAEFEQRNAVVPTPGDTTLTGDDYLATLDLGLAGQVRALAEGRRAFPTGAALRDPKVQELIAAATQYDPTLDAANAATRVATRKNFTSGKARQNITAINTALGHLGSLAEAAEELDNSSFPLWNSVANTAISAVGDPRLNKFVITRDAVANELMRVFRQVGASTTEIEEWKETISSSDSPEQLRAEITQATELLNSRLLAMQDEYQAGMGSSADVYQFLSPHAREVFNDLLPGVLGGDDDPEGGGAIPTARQTPDGGGGPIAGIREPTREQIFSGGIQWGDQTNEMQDSVASYLEDHYGVGPGTEAEINAFWNANRGNSAMTVDGVREWYRRRGIGVPQDAEIAAAIEMAQKPGVEFTGSGAEAAIAEYYDQLDAALEQRGANPESTTGAAGISAAEGLFPLLDEAAGVGGAVAAAAEGQNPLAGYQVERDILRREQARAEEAHPVVSTAANLTGAVATGGAGFQTPARLARAAATARRLGDTARAAQLMRRATRAAGKAGAAVGAGYGYSEGEGLADSAAGAAVGAGAGGAASAGLTAVAPLVGRAVKRVLPKRGPKAPTAAENYAAGQRYGMDLSLGDAGGMTPKILERGLDVLPGSASVMNSQRGRLGDQMVEAVDDVAGTFGPTTSFRGVGEAVQRGIKNWKGRFDRVAERAYQAIPIKPATAAIISSTVGALEELTTKITSNPRLAEMLTDKRLVGYLEALRGQARNVETGVVDMAGKPITREVTEGGSLSWNDLKQLRSRIGEEIGEQRFGEGTLKSDLRRLYAALSSDMEATARSQGPRALASFEKANRLYREGQERLDRVWESILGPDGSKAPEAAASIVQRIAKEGKSSADLGKLAELRRTLKPDEWGEVSNGLLRLLGQPANSEGRAFAADTFVRNFADMAPEAKNLLFGGENKALRQNLDEFARVVGLVAESKGTRNTSWTGATLMGAAALQIGNVPGLLLQTATSYGGAKLWTNPGFVRWMTGYTKMMKAAAANGGRIAPKAHENQMGALSRLAGSNAVIAGEARELQRRLLEQFEPGALPIAAQDQSSDADSRKTGAAGR